MKYPLIVLFSFFIQLCHGQSVGIGTTSPEPSAILDISSTSQGFLLPRMTTAQRDAISNPAQGLKIYNVDDNCLDTYDGEKWGKNCNLTCIGSDTIPANSWWQRADFEGQPRYGAVSFVIDGKVYVGTGRDDVNALKDFWEYDPISDIWTKKSDFGGGFRYDAIAFTINGKGYVGTGRNGATYYKDFWEYDPITDIWVQRADIGSQVRSNAVGFSVNGFGYVGLGTNSTQTYKFDFYKFDPGLNTWGYIGNFSVPRHSSVSFVLNNKAYIGLGESETGQKNDLWEFNHVNNTWSQKANFGGAARSNAVAFIANDKAYIGTGYNSTTYYKDFYEYNATANSWQQVADYGGEARYKAIAFAVNGNGFVGTGYDGNIKNDFWKYFTEQYIGKVYKESIPPEIVLFKGHHWTSEGSSLYTTSDSYKVGINTNEPEAKLHIRNGGDISLTSVDKGFLQLGATGGTNIIMDNNEIMARNNGTASTLYIQNDGGLTNVGGNLVVDQDVDINGGANIDGNVNVTNNLSASHVVGSGDVIVNGNLYLDGEIEGKMVYHVNQLNVSATTNSIYLINTTDKSFIKVVCQSGLCLTCSGSGCPDAQLSSGTTDGQILILFGSGEVNRNIYMPCCSSTSNYKLSANFQLTAGNTITLIWLDTEDTWYELSRSNND